MGWGEPDRRHVDSAELRRRATGQGLPGEQPPPRRNAGPIIQDLVIADMRTRLAVGIQRYGTGLQPHNGRDALRDAYEEALDLATYLRQAMYERDGR